MTDPLSLIPAQHLRRYDAGKFAPKLYHAERCAVLAFIRHGVKREIVASAFGIDKRTVSHISNPASIRYKNIREEYAKEGHYEFLKKYITEEAALRVAAVAQLPSLPAQTNVSARAARMAGTHTVHPEQCAYDHKIEVKFLDGGFGEGWYFRDVTNNGEGPWLHNGDESRRTSQACFEAAQENLLDE